MHQKSRNILLMMDVRRHFQRDKVAIMGLLIVLLTSSTVKGQQFSQSFDDAAKDGFVPFQPINLDTNYLTKQLFSETGQYRIFATADESDLRRRTSITEKSSDEFNPKVNEINDDEDDELIDKEVNNLERTVIKYAERIMSRDSYEIASGIRLESDERVPMAARKFDPESNTFDKLRQFAESHIISVNVPRALESGRLFFFAGLKKVLWPLFIGLQIVKSMLLALFLPSLLGSLGKIVGKAIIPGISSVSGFNKPSETVGDLEFKDTTYDFDDGNKIAMNPGGYVYQPEASTTHFATQMYDAATLNNNALSRFGVGDKEALANYYNSKNSAASVTSTAQNNNFKVFQNMPASSLLLSNYDPFYSPLLSRLDSIFQQMGLAKGNEVCREKLVCLMYANPAKYAPYSNLVSAQLSRELNELRKPTSDNPDILRFFKYMRAAKDGQDGVSCEKMYATCETFKDSDNPAMVTTYHDINKLVQARKLTS